MNRDIKSTNRFVAANFLRKKEIQDVLFLLQKYLAFVPEGSKRKIQSDLDYIINNRKNKVECYKSEI